jgi:hypothetical protein
MPLVVFFNVVLSRSIQNTDDPIVKANWDVESVRRYYDSTRDKFYQLNEICCDIEGMCCDSSHSESIDKYCDQIIKVLHDSTVWQNVVLHKKKNKFTWSTDINVHKQYALQKYKNGC